jgi:hypothetical protein
VAGPTETSGAEGDRARAHDELADALLRTRGTDAQVDLAVEVKVDGVTEARIATVGRIEHGGDRFDLQILGPAPFGLAAVEDRPVAVRLVDHRFFQRGPVVASLFPEAGGRWVETTSGSSSAASLGLIGPGGFGVLDLLADPESVTSSSAGHFEGTLGEVEIDGASIVNAEQALFDARVHDGGVDALSVTMRSANGVELSIDLVLSDPGESVISLQDPADIHRP